MGVGYAGVLMGAIDRLNELDDLLIELEVRNLHPRVQEFLALRRIKCGNGWERIRSKILDQADRPGFGAFLDAFETFVRDTVLVSQKHAYVLVNDAVDPASLVPNLPAGNRRDYLAGKAPERGDRVSYFLEKRKIGRAQIYTFVTNRPVRRSDDLDAKDLSTPLKRKYKGARIVAKYVIDFRCYDHIVMFDRTAILLLDAPNGVDPSVLAVDSVEYNKLLRGQLRDAVPEQELLYVDLFPAVARLWKNGKEGIVNCLKFVSNNKAEIGGKYSLTSTEDYRKHRFQIAGAKEADCHPFWIALRWPERTRNPMVVLPGKKHMASGGLIATDGRTRTPLSYMMVPLDTAWEDFLFAIDRVQRHLQDSV